MTERTDQDALRPSVPLDGDRRDSQQTGMQGGLGYQLFSSKATDFAKVSSSCVGGRATSCRDIRRNNIQILEARDK
jgi:hypothetical protein